MAEHPWLRETVEDEDVALLFTAAGVELRKAISYVMERAAQRSSFEETLLRLLELAVDEGIDDTDGSVWISLVLGEIQSRRAIPIFLRALSGEDEALCDAAVDALRRIGEPGFDAVMEALEENDELTFQLAGYRTLEGAATWDHPYLLEEVKDFLLARVAAPNAPAPALEGAALALAQLGDRRALRHLKTLLKDRFEGVNASVQDAVEMLEENQEGIPLITSLPPWEDRLAWLTGESFRAPPQGSNGKTRAGPFNTN
jgi:HEAT repeat protein